MTQSRTSYLPKEVLWGYRFVNLISYDRINGTYLADYDKCDDMLQIDTALCSARRLDEVLAEFRDIIIGVQQPGAREEQQLQQQQQHYYYDHRMLATRDDDDTAKSAQTPTTPMSSMRSSVDVQQQNSTNTERVQFRHLDRLAEELEYRLSNHSLHFDQQQASRTAAVAAVCQMDDVIVISSDYDNDVEEDDADDDDDGFVARRLRESKA